MAIVWIAYLIGELGGLIPVPGGIGGVDLGLVGTFTLRHADQSGGYPRRVIGRDAIADLYRPYGTQLRLDRCFDLAVCHDRERKVIVLQYASEGSVVTTGATYANRYVSVLTIEGRKVARWRDYLDPLAVFDALGWPQRPR